VSAQAEVELIRPASTKNRNGGEKIRNRGATSPTVGGWSKRQRAALRAGEISP